MINKRQKQYSSGYSNLPFTQLSIPRVPKEKERRGDIYIYIMYIYNREGRERNNGHSKNSGKEVIQLEVGCDSYFGVEGV